MADLLAGPWRATNVPRNEVITTEHSGPILGVDVCDDADVEAVMT